MIDPKSVFSSTYWFKIISHFNSCKIIFLKITYNKKRTNTKERCLENRKKSLIDALLKNFCNKPFIKNQLFLRCKNISNKDRTKFSLRFSYIHQSLIKGISNTLVSSTKMSELLDLFLALQCSTFILGLVIFGDLYFISLVVCVSSHSLQEFLLLNLFLSFPNKK